MERRLRQRRKNSNPTAEESPTSIHDVPDDLLRLILLLLDSPLWLLRAACACKRWRRAVVVVAGSDDGGRSFLRLASSLHPPAVVGHYHNKLAGNGRSIVFAPSSPPSIDDGGRFSLDFLPRDLYSQTYWSVADCHGGLVLLFGGSSGYYHELEGPELIVCDPLTRRHQGIYLPPDEKMDYDHADVFLVDSDDGNISISNFRVLYRFDKGYVACVFSTAANGESWRLLRKAADGAAVGDPDLRRDRTGRVAGRIDGALYVGLATGTVMVLDNTSLEFSEVDLPIRVDTSDLRHWSAFTVVHSAGADPTSPPTTRIVHVYGGELEVFLRVHGSGEWVLEHSIPLLRVGRSPEVDVMAGGTGLAFLCEWLHFKIVNRTRFLSIDVETMELQEVPNKEAFRGTSEVFAYTLPWPRFLRACPC